MAQKVHRDDRTTWVATFDGYRLQDDEKTGTTSGTQFTGFLSPSGEWIIQEHIFAKVGAVMTRSMRFATDKNNPLITGYTDAFANRATLTYDLYEEVFDA